jgi:hypothetical protein
MGYFSWKTNDSNRTIWNKHSAHKPTKVYMLDNLGNAWKEVAYDGYGVFGGKDFYVLLAEMNGIANARREDGIALAFRRKKKKNLLWPNLVTNKKNGWSGDEPKSCETQGIFG